MLVEVILRAFLLPGQNGYSVSQGTVSETIEACGPMLLAAV